MPVSTLMCNSVPPAGLLGRFLMKAERKLGSVGLLGNIHMASIVACIATASLTSASFGQTGIFEILINSNTDTVTGMSDDGTVITGIDSQNRGWIWREGVGRTMLAVPAGYVRMEANGVSSDGRYIAARAVRNTLPARQAARFDSISGTYEMAGHWNGTGSTESFGISPDGAVLAMDIITTPGTSSAGRWRVGSPMEVLQVGENPSINFSFDATNDGSTVGRRSTAGGVAAFAYTSASGYQILADPIGAGESAAMAITPDGRFISGRSSNRAIVWADFNPIVLDPIPGINNMIASCLSDDASVIGGGFSLLGGSSTAWIWTAETGTIRFDDYLMSLGFSNLPTLSSVSAISPDKRIIVGKSGSSTYRVTFDNPIATITIPAPCSVCITLAGAITACRRRRQ